jgi:hypothetical protein
VTADVELRVLSATVIQRGDVTPELSVSISVPASVEGEGVVTQVVVGVGDLAVDGAKLIEVSGRPIFVMQGEVPVYRTLRPTMVGDDVRQLQDALVRLGFAPEVDGVFGENTKSAVTAFYQAAGYDPVASSATSVLDIAQARAAASGAQRRVDAAQQALSAASSGESDSALTQARVALNQARRAADAARRDRDSDVAIADQKLSAAARDRERVAASPEATDAERDEAELAVDQAVVELDRVRRDAEGQIVAADEAVLLADLALQDLLAAEDASAFERDLAIAEEELTQAHSVLAAALATSGPTVPQGEIVFVRSLPARVVSARSAVGAVSDGVPGLDGKAGSGVLELAVGRLVVTTTIVPADFDLLPVGLEVQLLEEARSLEFAATIVAIESEPRLGIDGRLGYRATLTPVTPLPDSLSGANVRVTATAASTRTAALVVPLAAVSSGAGGSARVTVVTSANDSDPREVEIIAGLSADGFVAIEPVKRGSLQPGDQVVVGR